MSTRIEALSRSEDQHTYFSKERLIFWGCPFVKIILPEDKMTLTCAWWESKGKDSRHIEVKTIFAVNVGLPITMYNDRRGTCKC